MTLLTICVAGAESTGKSWLASRLAAHFGTVAVVEYARAYCALHGNNLSPDQLTLVASVQEDSIRGAAREAQHRAAPVLVADTDALVTAAWAVDAHGAAGAWFDRPLFPFDLTLVTENDLPWIDDGVRIQRDPAERDRFRATLIDLLMQRERRWASVGGAGEARFDHALQIVVRAMADRTG